MAWMASEKENQCNCIAVKHFTVRINRFRQYSWLCDGHAQKTEFSCWIHGCRLYSGHVCVHRNVPIIQKKQYFRIWDISVKETRLDQTAGMEAWNPVLAERPASVRWVLFERRFHECPYHLRRWCCSVLLSSVPYFRLFPFSVHGWFTRAQSVW